MHESTAGSEAEPRWRRLPWWDIMFAFGGVLTVAAVLLYDAFLPSAEQPWRTAVVLALGAALLVVWFTVARRHVAPSPAGIACLALITVISVAEMTLVPPLGVLQGLLFPYLWSVLRVPLRSIVASVVVAASVLVVGLAASGIDALPTLVITQSISLALSVAIGLTFSYAWAVADRRQALLDELTSSHARIRELSHQQGVSLERERLSRELHDTLAQTLAGLSLIAERAARGARRAAETGAPLEGALAAIDQVAELSRTALAETRALIAESAPVHGAEPAPGRGAADGLAFRAALERLADRFRRETGIEIAVDLPATADGRETDPLETVARDHQVVLLRCLQEGLANVRRHANATRADVRLGLDGDAVSLEIVDDGRGFDPERAPTTGFGLPGLRDRARLLDGEVSIGSAPGAGTRVLVRLPGTVAPADPGRATAPNGDDA